MNPRSKFHAPTSWPAWLLLAVGAFLVIPGQADQGEAAASDETQNAEAAADPPDVPDEGDEEQGSDLLREIRRNTAPVLAEMARDHGYGLAPNQDVGRVGPPFPPIRMVYYLTGRPGQAEAIPDGPTSMTFRWTNGRLQNWGMSFGGPPEKGQSLTSVLDDILGVKSHQLDGDHMLLARVAGDWIIRPGRPAEEVLPQLEKILRDQLSLPVSLEFREVERPVYVARGEYKLTSLPGHPDQSKLILTDETIHTDPIEVFGKQLVPGSGAGGGTGEFDEFLEWLGRWIETPIVDEVTTGPSRQLSWSLHQRSPFTDQMWKEDHDPDLVLPNITAQTGITFEKETRRVKILFVEQRE